MTVTFVPNHRWRDYSLLGKDAALAREKGLVDARWYATPIMIQAATVMLKNFGVPPAQIAYDKF